MKNYFKSIPNRQGGFDTYETNLGNEISGNIQGYLMLVMIALLVCIVSPVLLLIVIPLMSRSKAIIWSIISMLTSLYIILDFKLGWLLWDSAKDSNTLNMLLFVVRMHIALLFTTLVLLILVSQRIKISETYLVIFLALAGFIVKFKKIEIKPHEGKTRSEIQYELEDLEYEKRNNE